MGGVNLPAWTTTVGQTVPRLLLGDDDDRCLGGNVGQCAEMGRRTKDIFKHKGMFMENVEERREKLGLRYSVKMELYYGVIYTCFSSVIATYDMYIIS